MNSWNLIGLLAWVILIAYLIFIVWHIRQRHIKAIVKSGKQVRGSVVLIDIAEVLVFAIAAIGMVWVSWLLATAQNISFYKLARIIPFMFVSKQGMVRIQPCTTLTGLTALNTKIQVTMLKLVPVHNR